MKISGFVLAVTFNVGTCFLPLLYLFTPWSRILLEKLTGSQLVKKFPAFYGTQRFSTAFTNARHLSLSWTSSIQSIPPHPSSWRSILISSSHLRLGLTVSLESFLFTSPVQTGKSYLFGPTFRIIVWHIPTAVYTVLDCWWWTEKMSETCRVLFQK